MRLRATTLIVWVVLLGAVAGVGCAARGARNRVQVSAVATLEGAISLSKLEKTIASAELPFYTPTVQVEVNDKIVALLTLARGYERAARAIPAGGPIPAAVESARLSVLAALDDFASVFPKLGSARDPIERAVAAIRAFVTPVTPQASLGRAVDLELAALGL